MNLVIDEGNTRTKVALFEGSKIVSSETYPHSLLEIDLDNPRFSKCEACIISSVKHSASNYSTYLKTFKCGIYLDAETPIPIENLYNTKETLGKDRLAAAVGAFEIYPSENILVIDAGTAITYEYVSKDGTYLGGAISPGLELRFKALHSGTSMLPLVNAEGETKPIGRSTNEAIQNGVVNGLTYEIDGVIDQFLETFKDARVIGTGGDINFFDKKLKNSIFVLPNLVLIGLNRILRYNA